MEYVDLDKRIQQVLYKMLEPSFVIEDDQLKTLLDYLTGKEDDFGGTGTPRITETFFLPWIKRFTDSWHHSQYIIKTNVLLFTSDLTIVMSSNENFFVKLNFTDILHDFIELLRSVPEPETVTRIKSKYVEVMTSLLGHKCGLQWTMANKFWFDVFTMISRTKDDKLIESSCDFVVELLDKSKFENEKLCYNIFQMVMAPLKEADSLNDSSSLNDPSSPDDSSSSLVLLDGILLSLKFLELFLEALFRKSCATCDMKSAQYLLAAFDLEAHLEKLLETGTNLHVGFVLFKLLITVRMLQLAINVSEKKPTPLFKKVTEKLFDSKINLIKQFGGGVYLAVVFRSHTYLKWLAMVDDSSDVTGHVLFQLFIFNMIPLHHYIFKILTVKRRLSTEDSDEVRELFTTKLIRKIDSNTFQDLLRMTKSGLTFNTEDAILALRYIARSSELYDNSVASSATQMLIYHVVDIFRHLRDHPEKMRDQKNQEVVGAYLDTIMIMVEKFDLNWKDNVEVIYVTDIAAEVLSYQFLTTTAVVQGLELLNVAIGKSLSPNMALLIDNMSDTEINFVQIVYDKLSDSDAEVRRTGVRVVKTMCGKAKKNFNSYRQLLIDKDFPSMVFKMATSDEESIVMVAALRCLQEMIEVDEFWEELMNEECYYDKLLHIIYFHPDESTRSESVTLLTLICQSKHPPESTRVKINDATIYSVLEDSSLAVKTKGLEFWHEAIRGELDSYGAIDGHFPEATFSSRLKKIIQFDEVEIVKCLEAVLDRLADVGCLGVFLYAVRSEDEAVRGKARQLLRPFLEIVARHLPIETRGYNHLEIEATYDSSRFVDSPDSAISTSSIPEKNHIKEDFLKFASDSKFLNSKRQQFSKINERSNLSSILQKIMEQQNYTKSRNNEIAIMELTGG